MIVATDKSSKHYTGNNFYDIWLNGSLVKFATYADDINGVVALDKISPTKIVTKIRRGKVKIIKKDEK